MRLHSQAEHAIPTAQRVLCRTPKHHFIHGRICVIQTIETFTIAISKKKIIVYQRVFCESSYLKNAPTGSCHAQIIHGKLLCFCFMTLLIFA